MADKTDDSNADYTLNVKAIATDTSQRTSVRLLAMHIQSKGITSVGDCLKSLSDQDVERINEIDFNGDASFDDLNELGLLSLLLYHAEGGILGGDDTYEDTASIVMQQALTLIACEGLYRKGMIELIHENISFDSAASDLMVARITDKGRDQLTGE